MASIGKELVASFVVGTAVVGGVAALNYKTPPSRATSLALVTIFPVWVLPFGLAGTTAVRQLADYFTPFEYKKTVKEKQARLQNYMYNKRFMMVDLPLGQVVLPFLMATGSLYLARLFEDFYQKRFGRDDKGLHLKSKLREQDVVSLVKARWALILIKIMNEIGSGYRELKGHKNAFRGGSVLNALLNMSWQLLCLQTFLERDTKDSQARNKP